jgi:hypothetical protein
VVTIILGKYVLVQKYRQSLFDNCAVLDSTIFLHYVFNETQNKSQNKKPVWDEIIT